MAIHDSPLRRRDVLALGATLAAQGLLSGPSGAAPGRSLDRVPTRPFGRSGERVSILGLGGYFDISKNPELLAMALQRGVTYWEVTLAKGAAGYGAFFRKNPSQREHVFLLAKAKAPDRGSLDGGLARTLKEAETSYVDFFLVQGVSDPGILTPVLQRWVEEQKAAGKIKYFGFSTHANMAACLVRASTSSWIDGIVTAYNYRLMERPEVREAIDACARAGIALSAIKTQALPSNPAAEIGTETQSSSGAMQQLVESGYELGQAKLRAVWANPHISTVLSLMGDAATLQANCDAACAPGLTSSERESLSFHARATSASYCAGCASLCESRIAGTAPISEVMRLMMYAHGYRDLERARTAFAALPAARRQAIATTDYTAAERACPQGIEIAKVMRQASSLLA